MNGLQHCFFKQFDKLFFCWRIAARVKNMSLRYVWTKYYFLANQIYELLTADCAGEGGHNVTIVFHCLEVRLLPSDVEAGLDLSDLWLTGDMLINRNHLLRC